MQKLFSQLFGTTPPTPPNDPVQDEFNRLLDEGTRLIELGHYQEALQTYQQGVQFAQKHGNSRAEQFFLSGIGNAYTKMKNFDEAEIYLRQALNLANHLDNRALISRSLNNLGELSVSRGDWANAQRYHEQAVERARSANDIPSLVSALESLARDFREQNNPSYALHLLKDALSIVRKHPQHLHLEASVLGKIGETAFLTEERHTAKSYLRQALMASQRTAQMKLASRWFIALGRIELDEGNYREALQFFVQAQELGQHIGFQSKYVFLEIALNLANIYVKTGNFDNGFTEAERAYMHAKDLGDEAAVGKAIGYMGISLHGQGQFEKARQQIKDALVHYENGTLDDQREYVQLLLALGRTLQSLGEADAANETFARVLELARQSGNMREEAEALQLFGRIYENNNEREKALEYYKEALTLYENAGEKTNTARLLCDMGNVRRLNGDFSGALTDFEKASLLLSSIEDRVTHGLVMSNAANLYTETGDLPTAQSFYEKSIELAQDLNDPQAQSLRLGNFGWFYILTGQYETGIATIERAIGISRDQSNILMQAIQTNNLAYAYYMKSELATANNLFNQAMNLIVKADSERWKGIIKANYALVFLDKDELAEAERLLKEALVHSTNVQDLETEILIKSRLAAHHLSAGRSEQAEALAVEAETAARKIPFKRGQADALHVLGDIYTQREELDTAQEYYKQAHKLYEMLHDPRAAQMKALY
ncbi:MAG: tetratricopeptide repeat protein [Chloroflexi bacterium]|nr:tetratricopeptide repeat protein [Chloroflexota bacterium]